ncbi:MAG: hypothetical protein HY645_07860 [Acidobacteria bacterium]|nr:hypothetical protein [Acidobacteriota bacterium]
MWQDRIFAFFRRCFRIGPMLLLLVLVLTSTQWLAAGVFQKGSLKKAVDDSSAIIIGQVFSKKSYWDDAHRFIYTDSLILVSDVLKGSRQSMVTVTSLGGEVGDRGMINTASENFLPGEAVLLFLLKDARGKWVTLNMAQGKFQVVQDQVTGELRVRGSVPGGNVLEDAMQSVDGLSLQDLSNRIRGLVSGRVK